MELYDHGKIPFIKKRISDSKRIRTMPIHVMVLQGSAASDVGWLLIGFKVLDPGQNPEFRLRSGDKTELVVSAWEKALGVQQRYEERLQNIRLAGALPMNQAGLNRLWLPGGVCDRFISGSTLNDTDSELLFRCGFLIAHNTVWVQDQIAAGKAPQEIGQTLLNEGIGGFDRASDFASAVFTTSLRGGRSWTSLRATNHYGIWSDFTWPTGSVDKAIISAFQSIMPQRVISP
jgi:hypothetical protein